jgi:methylaspartate ammonia-lyase
LLNPAEEIQEVVEWPLPPELRNGVSQALLSAAAVAQDISVVDAAAKIYNLAPASSPIPIHLLFDDLPGPTHPALSRITAASYGLAVGDDSLKELGKDGIRLQNRIRQLKNRAVRHMNGSQQESGFMFDLKGGYGMMYQDKSGAILGALFGLEQVVKPYSLRLVDPIIAADKQSQIEEMKKLQSYMRMRKMKTQLIGQTWIETAEDIHAFADNVCCSGVLLDMAQLGTLHQTIKLAQAARDRKLDVILAGVTGSAAVHTAIALNPTLLAVGTADISTTAGEINRTLAWRAYK